MKTKKRVRALAMLMTLAMVFTTMPMMGVPIYAADDTDQPVEVTAGNNAEVGNVTVTNQEKAVAAHGSDGQTASAKVNGDVDLTNEDISPTGIGVIANAETKGSASVDVTKNVWVAAPVSAEGISSVAEKKSDYAEVKVGGNVTALSPEGIAQGIYTSDGNVTVDGNVSTNGKQYAMGVTAMSKNQPSRIMIKGGLTAEGFGVQAAAISAEDETGDLTFAVGKGGITAVSKGDGSDIEDFDIPRIMPISTGLLVNDGSGKVKADIQSDIKSSSDIKQSTALWVGNWHSENHGNEPAGSQALHVHGNLVSDDRGVFFVESDYANPSVTDILVENEIQADKVGVYVFKHHAELLTGGVSPTNKLNLTAWKIKVNENGNVAEYFAADEENVLPDGISPSGADKDFEKKINYIIKTEKPKAGNIKVLNASGKALTKSHGYNVAHEGEKIILKADSGYQITAAYNGKDKKTALSKDKNGNFYLIVPKGGGVYLSSTVKKTATKKVKKVTVNTTVVNAKTLNAAVKKAKGNKNTITTIVLGKKVKKISKGTFKNYKKAKTLIVKTKKLKKSTVKKSLKGSKITKIRVQVGKKKANKKYVKKYKKIFTKKNAGKKVKVTL